MDLNQWQEIETSEVMHEHFEISWLKFLQLDSSGIQQLASAIHCVKYLM